MDKAQLEALLGRSLTTREDANIDLYLEIAKDSLEELLCLSVDTNPEGSGDAVEETLVYDKREGYSTVFTDIFTDISEVKVDGAVTTDYYKAFWDSRSNSFYNSIVLGTRGEVVEITANWGFTTIPSDLQLLWAQLFANVSKKYSAGGNNVKRKDVRNFSITYGNLTDDQTFIDANKRIIQKYSLCNIGYVLHGDICTAHRVRRCGFCS